MIKHTRQCLFKNSVIYAREVLAMKQTTNFQQRLFSIYI